MDQRKRTGRVSIREPHTTIDAATSSGMAIGAVGLHTGMTQPEFAVPLSAKARQLLDAPVHAALGTLGPDGSPQLSTMWVTREGDQLLFSTLAGRQKTRNIRRDPRVSVLLWDPERPVSSVEIRGSAEIVDDPDSLIDTLSVQYSGQPFGAEPAEHVRVVLRVTPSKVIEHD